MERAPFETVLVSANALLREGLTRILGADFHITVSACVVDSSVLDSLPHEPAILLIIDASDDFDAAIGQIEPFKRCCPAGRIVVLVDQHQLQPRKVISAFRAEANAYLTTFMTSEAFIKSLELVMLGETILPSAILTYLLNSPCAGEGGHEDDHEEDGNNGGNDDLDAINTTSPDTAGTYSPHLSGRQMSILRCLIEGNSNKAIARKMKIADATVKVHVKAILRKIRVDNRTQAAIWAMRNGPLIWANHNNLLDIEELPIQQARSLKPNGALPRQVSSSGCRDGPAIGTRLTLHHRLTDRV
jgi:two-component system nitrate/nitrite response regulator NarL